MSGGAAPSPKTTKRVTGQRREGERGTGSVSHPRRGGHTTKRAPSIRAQPPQVHTVCRRLPQGPRSSSQPRPLRLRSKLAPGRDRTTGSCSRCGDGRLRRTRATRGEGGEGGVLPWVEGRGNARRERAARPAFSRTHTVLIYRVASGLGRRYGGLGSGRTLGGPTRGEQSRPAAAEPGANATLARRSPLVI